MTLPVKSSKIATAVRVALLSSSPLLAAHAATLPIPCTSGACGPGVSGFVGYGAASVAQAGSKLTINQTSANAILNWQSFNISADGTVQFVQPTVNSVALNEIFDASPTQIFGALSANGRVFLINQNGIVFGQGAQVNVGGLIASTLNISPDAISTNGSSLNLSLLTPYTKDEPAFNAFTDANGNSLSQDITVQQGATIEAADGGQIYMFGRNVTNLGTIHTPDGQTILAGGSNVYLATSGTSDLVGMLVEVQGSGMVTNGLASNSNVSSPQELVGQIVAEHGNISLAALAVNQYGRLNANTSVTQNGSIYLEARNGTLSTLSGDTPGAGGTLVLGQNSDTEVTLDTSSTTESVDSVPQPKSTIQLSGATIQMLGGSVARATGGTIDVNAAQNLSATRTSKSDGSRFYMAPGTELDVSGASVTLPVSDNVIPAQLEATELADSPVQRNGPLHGQTIDFDIRANGKNPDGSTWWGTPLANVTGEILGVERNVVERNLTGGTVSIQSQGDVILSPGSSVNVSGGYIQYTGGYIDPSQLLTLWGQTVPVASANPDLPYAGVVNTTKTTDTKWGVTQSYVTTPSYYSPGYVEGKDAGTLDLSAPEFILDSTVSASTVIGAYQIQPTTVEPTTAAGWSKSAWIQGSMYRPYDEVPNGATLQIGTPGGAGAELVVNSVSIASGSVLPGLTNVGGSVFNPLSDPLPANFTSSRLQPSVLDSFEHVAIYTDGKFSQPADDTLSFASGGSLSVQADNIDVEGEVDIPAGRISLTAEPTFTDSGGADTALTLGSAASLIATGEWINDSTTLYPNGNPAPLYIGGGTISLTAATPGSSVSSAEMDLKKGSLIDVSAGAQLTSSGKLNAGTSGSITINAATPVGTFPYGSGGPPPPQVDLGATLRGYGLYQGASLSISVPGACIAATDCTGGNASVLWLSPQFFDSGGFSSYSVSGDQGGLSIAGGLTLQLMQQNLQLPSSYWKLADMPSLVGVTAPALLPDQLRQPVSLSLALNYPASSNSNGTNFLALTPTTPSLVLPEGTVLATDPGGSISLTSNTELDVEGTLRAPGGLISLALGSGGFAEDTLYPSHALWLGPKAILDASGVARIFPDSVGHPTGNVLAGGTVSLNASDGYLELLPGSLIDVTGASGLVDLAPPGLGYTAAQKIASGGGEIELSAGLGMVVGSTLEAAPGSAGSGANQPAGGIFALTLDSTQSGYVGAATIPVQIIVSPTLVPTVVAPGSSVPPSLTGYALLPADALTSADFSTIALKAVYDGAGTPGTIDFAGGVKLAASVEVALDSGLYSVDAGTTAGIQAPYVEFGNSASQWNVGMPPAATSGTGVLDVSAGFIQLYGTSSLQGIGVANFDSSGDLMLQGLQGLETFDTHAIISGGLYADGTVDLTADQIYPSTLTQFVISADPNTVSDLPSLTSGAIVIHGSEGANADLLSADGSLTLSAASITQDGVLRAPFGTIALYANSLTLGPGSLTSTSANGLTIPFGTTQAGTDWVYPLAYGYDAVYGTDGLPPPSQNILLNGNNVAVQSGAVIDISGGGDLQAYEWIAGTGGTKDVLGSTSSYAIIPALHADVAPYDPSMSAGTTLQPGEAVYLAGGSGVPAGTYILLPARYALLPGAYLVTPMSGSSYQDMQPGQTFKASDGGTIVAGYQTTMGLSYANSRWNGFDVTPPSIYMNEAQYTVTSGNKFFSNQESQASATSADATASNAAISAMRLPEDAGVLDLVAGNSLTLAGTLHTSAQSGARGAEVDISNPDIVVAASTSDVTQDNALVLTSASLNQLGVQTLLLGGESSDGTIETTAQTVTISSGAALSVPDLLLTAQSQISVESGASISATGSAPSSGGIFTLSGAGAFLSASAGPQASITATSTPPSTPGTLNLAAGSSLSASRGAVYLDATGDITASGNISVAGGDLAVQAPQIALGGAPSASGTTVLGQNVLATGDLRSILLISSAPIALYQGAGATAQTITIDAPGLVSGLTSGQSAFLQAGDTLSIGNTQGTSASSSGSQSGSLTLGAANIALQSASPAGTGDAIPTFGIYGFGSVSMDAQGTLNGMHNMDLSTDGNLTVTASGITTGAGANVVLAAAGAVQLLSPGKASTVSAAGLGGALQITGSSIEVADQIDLPSGNVALTATSGPSGDGSITLASGGALNVAGVVQRYGATSVATPGGNVTLSATGDVALASGSAIDVSAGSGGVGGSLSISAPTGEVVAQGSLAGSGLGASFSVDAQSFDFGTLGAAVNAGGFSGAQSYRLRGGSAGGTNDLVLASGQTITAQDVLLEADGGNVDIEGNINASGASGGQVTLATAGTLTLNGLIDASATSPGGNGGNVELDLTGPSAQLALGSNWGTGGGIDVLGAGASETAVGPGADEILTGKGGTVLLRVPDATVATVAAGLQGFAGSAIRGASSEVLEAYQATSTQGDVSIDSTAIANYQAIAQSIMSTGSPAVSAVAALDARGWGFTLEPGIEVDATGGITVNNTWDLSSWRYPDSGGVSDIPGILTLRAGGGVTFNQSLSDGFTGFTDVSAPPTNGTLMGEGSGSWSYRIVAGADMSAADPLAVAVGATIQPADVTIGSAGSTPVMVRTGTGFIDVAASGSFVLGNSNSVLYTAGAYNGSAPPTQGSGSRNHNNLPVYADSGGNISISAGGNVQGALASGDTNQFVNDWLWREGGASGTGEIPVAWSVQYSTFEEGVGALAGGNVTVRAGGDINDFSAVIASIGVPSAAGVDVEDGGRLQVAAGGSILGGTYFVGLGSATLQAGDSVGPSATTGASPLIGLEESSATISSRGNLQLAGIVNPTLLNTGIDQNVGEDDFYSTYGQASSAALTSIGGNVVLDNEWGAEIQNLYQGSFNGGFESSLDADNNNSVPIAMELLPPILTASALSGDIDVSRDMTVFPSPQASLQLFAAGNVDLLSSEAAPSAADAAASVQLVVPDADAAAMPSILAPQSASEVAQSLVVIAEPALNSNNPILHASTPVFDSVTAFDENPVQIVALEGDINFSTTDGHVGIWSGKPVVMSAGQDIVDPNLVAQNISSGDVTSISAGRDITNPESRSPQGGILANSNGIVVAGPGELQVQAGRNIDLGASNGVATVGNQVNTALPSAGASISVEAGVAPSAAQYQAFIGQYIDGSSTFDSQLVAYVGQVTGQNALTSAEAKQEFDAMPTEDQRSFVEQLFFTLLKTYGEEAARSGNNADFAGAYAAIEQLFPGANPNLSEGQKDPYAGDISLFFSKIYSEGGGSISLLAPGGEVNAGLALAPTSYGLNKSPQDLGIVAESTGDVNSFSYSDFQVNESRVFAADSGNILVWSTEGNIDAGRGSKTSLSAAAPSVHYDTNGFPTVTYFPPTAGSGIQALADTPGSSPGSVDLFAPHGVVNANDAGIVAGNLTIAATAVLGANNITVTGTEVGVPVAVTGLGTQALAGSTSAAGAASSAQASIAQNSQQQEKEAPQANAALHWLDVFVLGFGEENCAANDLACLKRQKHTAQ